MDGNTDADIRTILAGVRRIATVGASNRPERPSHHVMEYQIGRGYDVVPVNPGLARQRIHGRTVVATLDEAAPLEMVQLFRASDQVGPAVRDAIRLGARVVWMQLGVVNEAAAAEARAAGLRVVMNRCPAIEIPRLGLAA